jgi:hypothetical protein
MPETHHSDAGADEPFKCGQPGDKQITSPTKQKRPRGALRGQGKPMGSALEAELRRLGVGLQAFAISEHSGGLAQHLGARFAHLDEAASLLEVIDAQGR